MVKIYNIKYKNGAGLFILREVENRRQIGGWEKKGLLQTNKSAQKNRRTKTENPTLNTTENKDMKQAEQNRETPQTHG